ncbi:MAG: hypothetical protein KAS17_06610 [Victivallaceae bacterium]|nr:hypothetical protein [Victivallaceae bacterium]
MIRRSWLIYRRKSRRIVSTVYHRYRLAKEDLQLLNDYCQKKKYVIQIIKMDSETGKIVSRYPDINLIPLAKIERSDYG